MFNRRLNRLPGGSIMAAACAIVSVAAGASAHDASDPGDLYEMNLRDLMNVEVTSGSKKEQTVAQVPSAIFVIGQEDIQRSGALNVPDLLRMVPGLDVAQINANTWAISARGFNTQFANKLLVLIDGRSVYTPTQDGVNWDTQDVPLEDIDRIEVIRGPGATVWGSNAVNGVINIITKSAKDTHGVLAAVGGGTETREFGTLQYGGALPGDADFRLYAKYLNQADLPDITGLDSDAWHLLHGGFRLDEAVSGVDSLTVQGDVYEGSEGATIAHIVSISAPVDDFEPRASELSGGNLLGRWNHTSLGGSNASLKMYFDRYYRSGPESNEARSTADVEFTDELRLTPHQDMVWGADYRHTADQVLGTIDQAYFETHLTQQFVSAFFQDEIMLEHVALYVGTKVEHTTFVPVVAEPSIRVAFTPTLRDTWWAAVSEADRTPARRDVDADINLGSYSLPNGAAAMSTLIGNPDEKPERLLSMELGYRTQWTDYISVDVATFFNKYKDIRSLEAGAPVNVPAPVPYVDYPIVFGNGVYGSTDGIEISTDIQLSDRWRLSPGYALLHADLRTRPFSLDATTANSIDGSSPRHQVQLRSTVTLPGQWNWNVFVEYVDRLPAQQIDSYTRLDTQLRWTPTAHVEVDLTGQNLLHERHLESNDVLTSVNSSQIVRSGYAKITWKF